MPVLSTQVTDEAPAPPWLREFLLNNRELVQQVMPTKAEIEHLTYIRLSGPAGATTRDLVDHSQKSVQQVSNELLRLYKKGYITRDQIPDPSGGHMYVCRCALLRTKDRDD